MSSYLSTDSALNCRKLKIVLLGDKSVGKSSIIRRYTSDHFQDVMSVLIFLSSLANSWS